MEKREGGGCLLVVVDDMSDLTTLDEVTALAGQSICDKKATSGIWLSKEPWDMGYEVEGGAQGNSGP